MAEDGETLLPAWPRILTVGRIHQSGPWADFLGPEADFVRIDRRIEIGAPAGVDGAGDHPPGQFAVFAELYLPGSRFASLLRLPAAALDGVLIRDVLNQWSDLPTLAVEQRLTCGVLPPRACRRLGLVTGSSGTTLILRGRTRRGLPVSWQRVFIPPTDRALDLPTVRI